jgi:hypothetical protein
MHVCVNIYFSNNNKNLEENTDKSMSQIFMNSLINESFIFRGKYRIFFHE